MEYCVMLTLSRREGEALLIQLADRVDPSTPVGDLLADGLYLEVSKLRGTRVKLSVDAHPGFSIVRSELVGDGEVA